MRMLSSREVSCRLVSVACEEASVYRKTANMSLVIIFAAK